jgi:predicted AAA+ superfamily ATPase
VGVEAQKAALLANTQRFAAGRPANNALLWGARGAGKSALVKACCAQVAKEAPALKVIDVAADDIEATAALVAALADHPARAILFIDDLSFAHGDRAFRALKPALQGGLGAGEGRTLVYATSNRRHLVARDARENAETELHWRDAAEEHLALSDRFGLSLGFHAMDQSAYIDIVETYAARFALPIEGEALRGEALRWALARGARSGRTAWQFIVDLAGRLDRDIDF